MQCLRKKWIAALLTLALLLAFLPGSVLADPVFTDDYGHEVEWANFRNTQTNNAVTDRPTPTSDKEAWEKWSAKFGSGYSAAPTPPVIVDGKLYVGVGDTVLELDKETGDCLRTSEQMPGNVGYAMQSPVYADGKIFVAITNGRICAVNINDLSVAWTTDNTLLVDGKEINNNEQMVSPISYINIGGTGYVFSGTWTSHGGRLLCATTGEEDVKDGIKPLRWTFDPSVADAKNLEAHNSVAKGYYWTGAYVTENYLAIGSDNGSTFGEDVNDTAFYTLNPKTGKIIDAVYGIKGQVRSTAVYDNGNLYFSTKGAKLYKIPVDENGNLGEPSYIDLGEYGAVMATATPVVYGGRIYLGVQGKGNQFSADGGHGFLVVKDDPVLSSDSFLYNISVPGYPQAGALLSNYHEVEDFDGDGTADGRVYLFFTYNALPGGIFYTYDTPGQTAPTVLSVEEAKIFVPGNGKQQYCISSIVVDEEGNLYYKNDSGYLFAVEANPAAIENLTVLEESGKALALDRPFQSKIAQYSVSVPSDMANVTVQLQLAEDVTATVDGEVYTEDGVSILLSEEVTEIPVISYKNGKSRTYILKLQKANTSADLVALGSALHNSPPSETNRYTRLVTPELQKEVTDYTFDWITTGTGDSYDPAVSAMMNIFLTPESDKASVKVWPGENTRPTSTNADGSVKQSASSGAYKYRYPVYAEDLSRDSTARIVVTAEDGVTVKEYNVTFSRRIYVSELTLDQNEVTLYEGETCPLNASILPENATDQTITWTTSDASVADVDETGMVTAVGSGNAVVTAAAEDGTVTAECSVKVLEAALVQLSAKTFTYNGKVQKPAVTVKDRSGKTMDSSGYTVRYANKNSKKAGTYQVTVTFRDSSAPEKTLSYKINKAANTLVKGTSSRTVKYKNLRKKNQTFSLTATFKESAKKTYKLASVTKKAKKYIVVNKAGKVTIRKGLKKGTYTLRVKITSAATADYKKTTVTRTIKIRIK